MENIMDQIQPYVVQVVSALISILALIVLSFLALLRTRVNLWIDTKISASQRDLIHKIANEAFAYVEATMTTESGRNKLNQAFIYTSEKLGKLGIQVTTEEINAAIEKAVLEYNSNKKQAS